MRRALALSAMCLLHLAGPTAGRADDRPAATRCELAAFPLTRPVEAAPIGWRGLVYQVVRKLDRSETPDAALARLGGTRLILRADAELFRAALLNDLRNDLRCLLREARVGHGELAVRDGGVDLRMRDRADLRKILLAAFAATGPVRNTPDATSEFSRRSADISLMQIDDGLIRITPTQDGLADRLGAMLARAREIIAGRVRDLGIAQAAVEREGADRIRILLPGVADAARLVAMLGSRAKLELRLVDSSMDPEQALKTTVPLDDDVLYGLKDKVPYLVGRKVAVSGADIIEASPSVVGPRDEPAVAFRFDARGTRAFAEVTRENVGRPFAIVLDDQVISAPVIREPIVGGSGLINGNFTIQEANDLAVLRRSGALPLRLELGEQETVAAHSN